MKITFVLPFVAETGGVRAVLRFARELTGRGHRVTVVTPLIPFAFNGGWRTAAGRRVWLGTLRRNLFGGGARAMHELQFPVTEVPWVSAAFLPVADVVVATAWPTAYAVARLPRKRGVGVYYVFHREIDAGPPAMVDASYRLPLFRTALSQATADVLAHTCGVTVEAITPVGVDAGFWGGAPAAARRGVLMMSGAPRKGGEDGLRVLADVRARFPDLPIVLFGRTPPPSLPRGIRFETRPDDERLRALYAAAQVFLYPSHVEGFGMPPLEAMAAGCAVVTTRVGAVPDFSRNGVDALWAEAGDVDGLTAGVIALLDDPARASALGAAARERAREFGWEHATDRLEAALTRAAAAGTAGG